MNSDPPLLKPSEALNRLQPKSIESGDSETKSKARAFETIRYGFELGAIGVLTPSGMVCEVMDVQRIFHLPNAPAWLSGLINLRGNLCRLLIWGGCCELKIMHKQKTTPKAILIC